MAGDKLPMLRELAAGVAADVGYVLLGVLLWLVIIRAFTAYYG